MHPAQNSPFIMYIHAYLSKNITEYECIGIGQDPIFLFAALKQLSNCLGLFSSSRAWTAPSKHARKGWGKVGQALNVFVSTFRCKSRVKKYNVLPKYTSCRYMSKSQIRMEHQFL